MPKLRDNWIRNFPKGISPEVNAIIWLEFEYDYNNIAVQHVTHHATRTSLI